MMDRDEAIAELKRVAALLRKDRISVSEFRRHGNVGLDLITARFGTWNKAVEAAGLTPIEQFKRIGDTDLREEFHRVYAKLGKAPTRYEFAIESRFSYAVYKRRFGGWRKAIAFYLGSEMHATAEAKRPRSAPAHEGASSRTSPLVAYTGKAERRFGPPLNFRGLRHEPVNEQGVVFLFGMLASELGFLVEAIQTGYPDCTAKRLHKDGYYVEARIEFEFASSRFAHDPHDPKECGLIVCWVHDWPECPIEVLELKSAIKQLKADV